MTLLEEIEPIKSPVPDSTSPQILSPKRMGHSGDLVLRISDLAHLKAIAGALVLVNTTQEPKLVRTNLLSIGLEHLRDLISLTDTDSNRNLDQEITHQITRGQS
jgi:hypothetical protein